MITFTRLSYNSCDYYRNISNIRTTVYGKEVEVAEVVDDTLYDFDGNVYTIGPFQMFQGEV